MEQATLLELQNSKSNMPKIEVKDLTVIYLGKKNQETVGLEHFNATFEDKKINVILGESGCGKTTLLNAIAQAFDYDGQILFDGEDTRNFTLKELNMAYINQDFFVFPNKTVYESLAFPLKMQKMNRKEIDLRVREISSLIGLDVCLTRYPKELSIGQVQRVAIAKALIKEPQLVLMDEPLSNLDPFLRRDICSLIKKLAEAKGMTVIYVTHRYDEALNLADRIYIIDQKGIEVSETPAEINRSSNKLVKYLKMSIGKEDEKATVRE